MTFDSLVFDLDGTLWDTCVSCSIAWNNVIKRNNIKFREITADDIRKVVGKPHEVCIRETFAGLSSLEIQTIIAETMTEDNIMVEKFGGKIYEGVGEGLQRLSTRYHLCIVSNCQSGYVETFLGLSGFEKLFLDFECWGNTNRSKAENVKSVITRNGLKKAVMIGDMESDLLAARICEIPFFHMTYGFGKVSSCDKSFASFEALERYLTSLKENANPK